MTLETVALLAFLSVNLKVIFLALPILPRHVLRITFLLHMALYKFFILYCSGLIAVAEVDRLKCRTAARHCSSLL